VATGQGPTVWWGRKARYFRRETPHRWDRQHHRGLVSRRRPPPRPRSRR